MDRPPDSSGASNSTNRKGKGKAEDGESSLPFTDRLQASARLAIDAATHDRTLPAISSAQKGPGGSSSSRTSASELLGATLRNDLAQTRHESFKDPNFTPGSE